MLYFIVLFCPRSLLGWPQQAEADEPGSVQYNYQVWRQQRNEHVIAETQLQAPLAGELCLGAISSHPIDTVTSTETSRWDRPVVNLQVSSNPLCMTLHAYDPHLIIANDTDMIRFARFVLVNDSVLTVL